MIENQGYCRFMGDMLEKCWFLLEINIFPSII